MSMIYKHIIFLKDKKGAVSGTLTLSFNKSIYIKARLYNIEYQNCLIAFEGDKLAFSLFETNNIKKDYKTDLTCELGKNISVILFEKSNKSSKIYAYGYMGENSIKKEILLEHALKRMIGEKIVTNTQVEIKKDIQKKSEFDKTKEIYKETYEILKSDPYLVEDTTLNDIDIIAEENYFDKYNKDFINNLDRVNKQIPNFEQKEEKIKNYENIEDIELLKDIEIDCQYNDTTKEPSYFNSDNNQYLYKNDEETEYFTDKDLKIDFDHKEIKFGFEDYGAGSYYNIVDNDFYTGEEENSQEEKKYLDNIIKNENSGDKYIMEYYNKIKTRLDKLLSDNEKEEKLCRIIPESQFVKIYYEKEKYYCVGLVKENDKPIYICYGVPKNNSENPPEEFSGICRWIPTNSNEIENFGYFMVFQNVYDGKYIKID